MLNATKYHKDIAKIEALKSNINDDVDSSLRDIFKKILNQIQLNKDKTIQKEKDNAHLELSKCVSEEGAKDNKCLLDEIYKLNNENDKILTLIKSGYLSNILTKINETYNSDSLILPQKISISSWQKDNIIKWSNFIKENHSIIDKNLPEVISVLNRANFLHTGCNLRNIQIISVLSIIESQKNGRLIQVNTGEGKSTIISIVASIFALKGELVDVITSSPILAQRDCAEKLNFYGILDLKCGENTQNTISDGPKKCYSANIIYGDVSSYQFDLLKDEYKNYNTRNNRPFGVCIVDEVDSMLIDEGSKIAKLSSNISGNEYLEPIFLAVWNQLKNIRNKYTYLPSTNDLVWIDGEFDKCENEMILLGDTSDKDVYKADNPEEFTIGLLENYVLSLIKQDSINVPFHLRNFVLEQSRYWAKSSVSAVFMEENKNYIVSEEMEVVPVAYDSTGITQEKTQWGDGLRQFLQIKHGLKIKPENITTCFISNMSYFHRYGNKIYGMTGTLGSANSQNLLKSTYQIDVAFIPTYKFKKFTETESIVAEDKER